MFQISINEFVYFCFARHSREALILFNWNFLLEIKFECLWTRSQLNQIVCQLQLTQTSQSKLKDNFFQPIGAKRGKISWNVIFHQSQFDMPFRTGSRFLRLAGDKGGKMHWNNIFLQSQLMQTSQSELKSNTHNQSLLSARKRAGVTAKEFIYLWIVQISELFVICFLVLLGCAFFFFITKSNSIWLKTICLVLNE